MASGSDQARFLSTVSDRSGSCRGHGTVAACAEDCECARLSGSSRVWASGDASGLGQTGGASEAGARPWRATEDASLLDVL
jgi:hypothetical protein